MIKSVEPTTAERIFLFSTLGANSSFLCWGIVDLASTEKLKSIQYGMDQLR